MPSIAVIGASLDRKKYGNKAVRLYASKGYRVYPIHPTESTIEGLKCYRSILDVPEASLDRVSLYLPPHIGMTVIEDVAKKSVTEVWLNPGSESPELISKAEKLGLNVIAGCSIVDLGMRPSELD